MNKSEFYLKWYSEHVNQELNAQGYPKQIFKGEEITTAEQWTEFLADELELDLIKRINPEAFEILEPSGTYVKPYEIARIYPDIGDQLDKLYHDIDAGKFGADAKTGDWFVDVKKVKDDTPKN